jgi:hypothetical protein
MAQTEWDYNDAKLKELILYLAGQSQEDPHFGRVKLMKLLFYCDFGAFGEFGRPITGARYRKHRLGPVADQELLAVRDLEETHAAQVEEVGRYMYRQKRLVPMRQPDEGIFTDAERDLIDTVLERHRDDHATDLSDLSHTFPGWRLVETGEPIPYHTALIADEPPGVEAAKRVAELAGERGWP